MKACSSGEGNHKEGERYGLVQASLEDQVTDVRCNLWGQGALSGPDGGVRAWARAVGVEGISVRVGHTSWSRSCQSLGHKELGSWGGLCVTEPDLSPHT